jgi:hypothetical protein
MKDIIGEAQKARFTVEEGASGEKGIAISDAWMAELQKHPYHSSKWLMLILVEKPGTGIFLMKESAKLHRRKKNERRRSWQSDSGNRPKQVSKNKTQAGHKKRDRTWEDVSSHRYDHLSQGTHR